MEIRMNMDDVKNIVANKEKKYSEIEVCLARKLIASDATNSEIKIENDRLRTILYTIFGKIARTEYYEQFKTRRNEELTACKNAILLASKALEEGAKDMAG